MTFAHHGSDPSWSKGVLGPIVEAYRTQTAAIVMAILAPLPMDEYFPRLLQFR